MENHSSLIINKNVKVFLSSFIRIVFRLFSCGFSRHMHCYLKTQFTILTNSYKDNKSKTPGVNPLFELILSH